MRRENNNKKSLKQQKTQRSAKRLDAARDVEKGGKDRLRGGGGVRARWRAGGEGE